MSKSTYDPKIITLALVQYGRINPRTFDLLLRHFGSPESIIEAGESALLSIDGITAESARKVSRAAENLGKASRENDDLAKKNIHLTTRFDSDYPSNLFEINDPPPLFYSRGGIPVKAEKSVALVGTETASEGGIALTAKAAKELVTRKVQIISSLDSGIATAVHLGAKAAGGKSFAVVDSGLDKIVGDGLIPLAIDLVQSGGVISEYAPDKSIGENNFKESNRLIAGMAQAVIVTEFHENSKRVHDILEYCHQIGKLSFVLTDPEFGLLSDEKSLSRASGNGAILMNGLDKINDIVKSLV